MFMLELRKTDGCITTYEMAISLYYYFLLFYLLIRISKHRARTRVTSKLPTLKKVKMETRKKTRDFEGINTSKILSLDVTKIFIVVL